MFSRSKPIRAMPLPTSNPKLPSNFAEDLLDLESKLASNLSITLISSLMQLYSCAIEYYESIQDQKYLHYKDRLHSLLSQKDVLSLLSQSAPKLATSSSQPLKKTFQKPTTTYKIAKKDPDEIITDHLHESSSASTRSKASLRDQEGDKLAKRLQARKRATSLRPQKQNDSQSPRVSMLEMFQNDIEAIMEKYAEEKIFRTQAIMKRYQDTAPEFPGKPRTQEELEKDMKFEIERAQIEILKERKGKISELRDKYET